MSPPPPPPRTGSGQISLARSQQITTALDPETKKEVLHTIRDLAAEGMTCILVTHEMGFAREVADHVYFTDGGVIVEHGPPKEILEAPRHERTRAFLDQVL